MTTQIQALIDSKRKFNDTTLFTDQVNRLVVELMREHAASEVDRLLDCLADSEDQEWHFSNRPKPSFYWSSANLITEGGQGYDKASLLEYVGFSLGDG